MSGCDMLKRFTCYVIKYDLISGNIQERSYM